MSSHTCSTQRAWVTPMACLTSGLLSLWCGAAWAGSRAQGAKGHPEDSEAHPPLTPELAFWMLCLHLLLLGRI